MTPVNDSTAQVVVALQQVSRRFGSAFALRDVRLEVRQGEFLSLLGPSGCGKSTLLRLIAGLDLPSEGQVFLNGTDAAGIPAHQRPVNTVFQSYALFPHLNVWNNVAFGLRMKNRPKQEIRERVGRMLDLMQISELQDRKPGQLSGGQKQRVALARAAVNEPQVLLLDEPLAALDLKLRQELQIELRSLQRRLGISFVYVTHDQEEALVMSDRIAVMNAGRIDQVGPARQVYERPRTPFVAKFLGACNLLPATREPGGPSSPRWRTPLGVLELDSSTASPEPLTLAIRPELIRPSRQKPVPAINTFAATVLDLVYTGSETRLLIEVEGTQLKAHLMNNHAIDPPFQLKELIFVQLPANALIPLTDD